MKKLIASIIAKDEQALIGKCLESIKEVDEIVVLDTGSNDQTVDICHKHKARVFYYRWNDDFAEARNKCLDYCKGDWIFTIDCDEVLKPGGIKVIRDAIDFAKNKESVFSLLVKTTSEEFYQPRLFRKDNAIYWKDKAHNQLNRKSDGIINATIEAGISPNHAKDPNRTMRILKSVLKENPTDARATYFYGRELMRFQMPDAALYWLQTFIEMSPRTPMQSDAYYRLALCYLELNRDAKAIEALHHSIMVNENFTKAWEKLSEITKKEKYLEFARLTSNENVLSIIY